jgi:hypothetical protein
LTVPGAPGSPTGRSADASGGQRAGAVLAGYGRLLVVGPAQWSDGRTADYQALADRLSPLMNKVTEVAGGRGLSA